MLFCGYIPRNRCALTVILRQAILLTFGVSRLFFQNLHKMPTDEHTDRADSTQRHRAEYTLRFVTILGGRIVLRLERGGRGMTTIGSILSILVLLTPLVMGQSTNFSRQGNMEFSDRGQRTLSGHGTHLREEDRIQQTDVSKWELGTISTVLSNTPDRSNTGYGLRVVYNFNRILSTETELSSIFRDSSPVGPRGDNAWEALFGVKAGIRAKRIGIFAKLRPGLVSWENNFSPACDAGGALEVFLTKRWSFRWDSGLTMVFGDSSPFANSHGSLLASRNFQSTGSLNFRF